MRDEIKKQDIELVDGIRLYNIPKMAELKTEAFINRNRARDTYDLHFLTDKYPDKIKEETWEKIEQHMKKRGLNDLCDSFDRESQTDDLLKKWDSAEIILELDKNIQTHKSLGIIKETPVQAYDHEQDSPNLEHEAFEIEESGDTLDSLEPLDGQQNMEPARQAAQKISDIGGIDKSADRFSVVEGTDVTEHYEKYLRDAVKGKQEIQEAETMNNAKQGTATLAKGERINIKMSGDKKVSGEITNIRDGNITLRSGQVETRIDSQIIKNRGWKIEPAPPIPQNKTMAFAQQKAKEIMGPSTVAKGAGNNKTYSGKIVELTGGYAIQAINANAAILHKLEDLSKAEKDGKGQIKIQIGESISVARDAFGVVSISPYNKEREEKELERQRKLQRGSQQVGSRSR
jgi:hypothetical protein